MFRGRADDWGDCPAALNMTVSETGLLTGTWDGHIPIRGLHTWELREDSGGKEYYRYYTELYAIFEPELLAGMKLYRQAMSSRAWTAVFGQKDLQLGHESFDKRYHVSAADPDLTRRILSGPPMELLLGAAERQPHLWVSDRYVTVEYDGYERDLDRCRSALQDAGRIAVLLVDARRRELAHWEPALRDSWSRIASAWECAFDPVAAKIHGVVRGTEITVETGYFTGLCTRVKVRLREPLGCELSLARQDGDGFFSRLFRGQDVELGDPAFDAAFVVKGEPEARVREVLSPLARQWLVALDQRAHAFSLKDDTLTVTARRPVVEAEALEAMLDMCFSAAQTLTAPATDGAPFR